MHGNPKLIDMDRDGRITVDEYAQWVALYASRRRVRLVAPDSLSSGEAMPLLNPAVWSGSKPTAPRVSAAEQPEGAVVRGAERSGADRSPEHVPATERNARGEHRKFYVPKSQLPGGLPSWFLSRDRNGDGQVSFAEYCTEGTDTEVREFARYDRNGDGVITPYEVVGRAAAEHDKSASSDAERGQKPEEPPEDSGENGSFEESPATSYPLQQSGPIIVGDDASRIRAGAKAPGESNAAQFRGDAPAESRSKRRSR